VPRGDYALTRPCCLRLARGYAALAGSDNGEEYHQAVWIRSSILAICLATVGCTQDPDPAGADAAVQRGLDALAAGETGGAVGEFVAALDADPHNEFAYYNLGYIAQSRGERGSAEGYYRAALDERPSLEAALFNLALLREQAGGTQEAIELYRQVISANVDNAEAHMNLGLLLLQAGRTDEGEVEIQIAIRLDPSLVDRLEDGTVMGASPSAAPP
jgi:Tfp pilus assembly protein PilF